MSNIYYNYTVGDIIWFQNDGNIVEAVVNRIKLEVDPDIIETIIHRKTYHVTYLNDPNHPVALIPELGIFPTLPTLMGYIAYPNDSIPYTQDQYSITYIYDIGDTVWTQMAIPYTIKSSFFEAPPDEIIIVECKVIQLTFNITENGIETIYHLLPVSDEYGILLREEDEVFQV